ncbi:hypothetical protein ACFOVU_11475 [Nocardiopsis sediminis]|uniref:Uncharacterized protein n=1 Tax=Nocardiopsis sediminis TaxID=1778267 RepID=A0ABV8FMD5_9ACTN
MTDQHDTAAVDFLYDVRLLKRHPRTVWVIAGVANPESIADHSHNSGPSGHVH